MPACAGMTDFHFASRRGISTIPERNIHRRSVSLSFRTVNEFFWLLLKFDLSVLGQEPFF